MSVRRLEFITKSDWIIKTIGAVIFASIFFCAGGWIGYLKGYEKGGWELKYLMSMPPGGLHMSPATEAIWSSMPNQLLSFVRIPPPEVAQLIKNFEAPPRSTTPSTSTTTTTIFVPEVKK